MKKIHLVFVAGIRTHYIKLYTLQQELRWLDPDLLSNFSFTFIDAKQHYDSALHDDFINELNLAIDFTLEHGNTNREYLWGSILQNLCSLYDQINDNCPIDYVVVFGDVITTVIASVAAMFKKYKVIHIEAGTRVKLGNSVEENCRKAVDHLSSMRFVSSFKDLLSLKSEGLGDKSFFSGDIIYDFIKKITLDSPSASYKWGSCCGTYDLAQDYILVSLHHDDNQSSYVIKNIIDAVAQTGHSAFYIIHPNMKKYFPENKSLSFTFADHIPYIDNLNIIKHARYVITDSGGIQREAFYLDKRCVVRSNSTIWEVIVDCGSNIVVGKTLAEIERGILWAELNRQKTYTDNIFGDGNAVKNILTTILSDSVS